MQALNFQIIIWIGNTTTTLIVINNLVVSLQLKLIIVKYKSNTQYKLHYQSHNELEQTQSVPGLREPNDLSQQ